MPPELAAHVVGPSVSAVETVERDYPARRSMSVASLWMRAVRLLGQALFGLPASTWLLVDLSLLSGGVYAAYAVLPLHGIANTPHVALWQSIVVFAFALMISGFVFGLYERETVTSRSRILTRVLLASGSATVIAYAIIYIVMYATVNRRVAGVAMATFLVGGSALRLAAHWAIHKVHRGLLVVGPRSLFESFEAAKANGLLSEYRVVGYSPTAADSAEDRGDPNNLGAIAHCAPTLDRSGVTDVVVCNDALLDPAVRGWMLSWLHGGLRVTNEATFYEKATGQILVDEITPSWFLFADLKVHSDERATLQRLTDLTMAIFGLVASAPLWPLIALAIKLDDGGPVFYSQDRVGQKGSVFRLYKFRTMRVDAENGRSVWASPDEPRVTRFGRFLRKTRLDELPQLFNILSGQMSVVGPRPERPDIVAELSEKLPYYAERHLLKPGLTGWAQISFRYGSSIEDARRKLQFDLYYLKHASFELDLMILFRTVGTFLRGAC